MTSRKQVADDLFRGVHYIEEVYQQWMNLPHERVHAFCRRQDALVGVNIWNFLITRAEEMEKELLDIRAANQAGKKDK